MHKVISLASPRKLAIRRTFASTLVPISSVYLFWRKFSGLITKEGFAKVDYPIISQS